ncbi:hypothetical protein Lal_00004849 [Lupinus albus]|uniref:Putative thaumatin n=1 Tax=Lupinus albus TaxID=3870 RepID=A0A6A4NJE5_LUPAL|nr:putative thaumatin [Lupinus albus]KAF1865474.1 hypothetical protein Lal_00004849 [Lupinus albus]
MAPTTISSLILFLFLLGSVATATVFTLQNSCTQPIWIGTVSGNGAALLNSGGRLSIPFGSSIQLTAPAGWSGSFWARTGCNFDSSGIGKCAIGDCVGGLKCTGGGVPPATVVNFTIGTASNNKDFYDVSVVDGYNVGIGVKAEGGTGDCKYAGCIADLNRYCPKELQVIDNSGSVVACKSACAAFKTADFCCTDDHSTAKSCNPTEYSKLFKSACPSAYSYAYDDTSTTQTCSNSNYTIAFCPVIVG